jgi:hypothetical protein
MLKNNNKKPHRALASVKSGYKKYMRYFVTALFAVILVFGLGSIIYKQIHKPSKASDTAQVDLSQIPGWWYQQYFGSSVCDKDACKPDADPDKDGLTNAQEYYYHTEPLNAFTAKDTLNDGKLVAAGFDPSQPGRKTFDEVSTPENLLGESLVFSQDIKQMVAESNDINKVSLPLVQDDELQIIQDQNADTYKTYITKLESTINKYFRQSDLAGIKTTLNSGNDAEVSDIKIKSSLLATELKSIPVPQSFLMFHKYNIALFQLLSEILPVPQDTSGVAGNVWYDKVQAFLAIQQKLDFEQQRMKLLQ